MASVEEEQQLDQEQHKLESVQESVQPQDSLEERTNSDNTMSGQSAHGIEQTDIQLHLGVEPELDTHAGVKRTVKLGRKIMCPTPFIAYHWAVKAGDKWYEISAPEAGPKDVLFGRAEGRKTNKHIIPHEGRYAKSCAGLLGGEIVGVTEKGDDEIDRWIKKWTTENPEYHLLKYNCQSFAFQFMAWLTNNNYKCAHRVNAGQIPIDPVPIRKYGRVYHIWSCMVINRPTCVLALLYLIEAVTLLSTIAIMVGTVSLDRVNACIMAITGVMEGNRVGLYWSRINIEIRRTRITTWGYCVGAVIIGIVLIVAYVKMGKLSVIHFKEHGFDPSVLALGIPAIISGITSGFIAWNTYRNEGIGQLHRFATAAGGNAIANYGLLQEYNSAGPFNIKHDVLNLTAQAVAGPGLGLFVDAIIGDTSASLSGNLIGIRNGFNANTGIGVRNANFEAHLLGFGGKIGADGVEINTPSFGVNACSVM